MKIRTFYHDRREFSYMDAVEQSILQALSPFYTKKTNETERVKSKSMPITLFFNIINTMYERIEEDRVPLLLVDTFWEELKPSNKEQTYAENINEDLIDYYPNREYERSLIFGALTAYVRNVFESTCKEQLIDALTKKCDFEIARPYFGAFNHIQVAPTINTEEMKQEMTDFYEKTLSSLNSCKTINDKKYLLYQIRSQLTADSYLKKKENMLANFERKVKEEEQLEKRKRKEENRATIYDRPEGASDSEYINLNSLLQYAETYFHDNMSFLKQLEGLLGGTIIYPITDNDVLQQFKSKWKLFMLRIESKQKSKPNANFLHLILHPEPKKLLKRLHQLIDGKSGAAVGAVLLRAQQKGYLSDVPTKMEFESEFTLIGKWNAIQNYTSDSNLKALAKANKIIIFEGE